MLLSVATEGVFHPRWSEEIQREVCATIERTHPGRGAAIEGIISARMATFDGSLVQGWHARTVGLMTPDPNDRHVLAAAITGNAGVIVTANLKDFPDDFLPPEIKVKHPDRFLCDMLSTRPDGVLAALRAVAQREGRDVYDVLEDLGKNQHLAPNFAAAARKMIENHDRGSSGGD